jgi:WD40 repeat protein
LSPDGRAVATWNSGSIELRELRTGRLIRTYAKPGSLVQQIAFSPDGRTLAAGVEQTVLQWDIASGRQLPMAEGACGTVVSIAGAPRGHLAVSARDDTIRLWDYRTGELRTRCPQPASCSQCLAFLPDGRLIAFSLAKSVVRIYDPARGKELSRMSLADAAEARDPALTPDGQILAARVDQAIRFWPMLPSAERARPRLSFGLVTTVGWSPDGSVLAVAGRIGPEGTEGILLWDLVGERELCRVRTPWSSEHHAADKEGMALAVSPDRKILAAGYQSGWVRLWDTATGLSRGEFRPTDDATAVPTFLEFSQDGKLLAILPAQGSRLPILLFEVATRQEVRQFDGKQGTVRTCTFLPDGLSLATAGDDTTVLLWDVLGTRTASPRARPPAGDDVDRLGRELGATEAAHAYRALQVLAGTPDQAVAWLREHLRPQPPADHDRIARLISDLGSDRYPTREQATRELLALDTEALPPLRQVLKNAPTLEVRRRIERLLEQLENSLPPDRLRGMRAVQLLEALATPAARDLLKEWAAGPKGGWLTKDAAAAVQRLDHRAAAGGLP